MLRYPAAFAIETPDGGGEAIKTAPDEPWAVTYPSGGFRWYGSVPEVKVQVRKRLREEHGGGYWVLLGEPAPMEVSDV